jgi:small GTP-binding protein
MKNLTIVVLGPAQAGKTSLLKKAKTGRYNVEYQKTIGVDFVSFNDNDSLTLNVFECGGNYPQVYDQHLSVNYTNATAIVCCAADDANIEQTLKHYIDIVRSANPRLPIAIVLTKADLKHDSTANQKIIDELLSDRNENCHYFGEVSAIKDTQEKINNFLLENTLALAQALEEKEAKEAIHAFTQKYKALKEKEWTPKMFRRAHAFEDGKETTLESLLENARHKKSSTTNKAFIALGWLNKEGEITDSAPNPLKQADNPLPPGLYYAV